MKKQTALLLAVVMGAGAMGAFNAFPAHSGIWYVETMDEVHYNSPNREAEGAKRY